MSQFSLWLGPKVRASFSAPTGPTPLPPAAAHALVRRMVATDTNSSSTSSSGVSSIFRARSTPVRVRIKAAPPEDVQATNEGYASVAKLSKWLADDPTSTKKVKQLRRGANVIAKSRKFDKVFLANAIVIEECIPRDCVSRQKVLLQKALSEDDDDCLSVKSCLQPEKKDWMKLSGGGGAITLSDAPSVSDKKKWLSNAFQTTTTTVHGAASTSAKPAPFAYNSASKARTEILTSNIRRTTDFGDRAKEKWRKRTPTKAAAPPSTLAVPSGLYPGGVTPEAAAAMIEPSSSAAPPKEEQKEETMTTTEEAEMHNARNEDLLNTVTQDMSTTMAPKAVAASEECRGEKKPAAKTMCTPRNAFVGGGARTEQLVAKESQPKGRNDSISSRPTTDGQEELRIEQGDTPVDFRLARELLVLRSKANGNDVEVLSAFQRRKAKFEMLEKESRRKTAALGMLKPAWEGTKEGYVKKYRADVAPKKGLGELP